MGRETFAMIMAVVGYIAGVVYAAVSYAPLVLWEIYLTYLFSGIFIFVFNKVLHLKASGHSCGIAGAAIVASYYIGLPAIIIWRNLVCRCTLGKFINEKGTLLRSSSAAGLSRLLSFLPLKLLETLF